LKTDSIHNVPGLRHYNRIGSVHDSYAAILLDSEGVWDADILVNLVTDISSILKRAQMESRITLTDAKPAFQRKPILTYPFLRVY
jgi:hypothetical protein